MRGNYRCGRCGLPKVNHVCQFVDTVGTNVGVQVAAPIIDVVTGMPFDGERFLPISSQNSPAPSRSHKSIASPRSAGGMDSMDVDDSSTISFGAPVDFIQDQRTVSSPVWGNTIPPVSQPRVLQAQLAMSLDGYEYVMPHGPGVVPVVQNPMLVGHYYPTQQPDPSSMGGGGGPFYPPMQDPSGGPYYPGQDPAYVQSAYDAFNPEVNNPLQHQQQQQQNTTDGSHPNNNNNTRTNGYGFVCTVNDQTDFACFPFFCFT